ncbi:MAG: SpoIIE family protein phosphatase, partial [Actinobacteria bacterium]|nr:SpoIIE family protein phosphatase [Actinomycetota bacterium]
SDETVLGVLELMGHGRSEADLDLAALLPALGVQLGQFVARRQAETQARVVEARKAAMVEAALDAVVSIDHEGRIVEWNDAAGATFGWRRDEVLGRQMRDVIVPPSLRLRHAEGFARHLRDGRRAVLDRRVEMVALRRDGSEFPVEIAVTRVEGSDGPLFIAFLRDISSRARAEAERLDLERREQVVRTRLELMGRLGDILTVDLDATERLQAIAAVLLPVFSDLCAVITPDGSGGVRFAALAHSRNVSDVPSAVGEWSPLVQVEGTSADAVITAQPQIIEPITEEMLELAFPDPETRAMVAVLGLKAVLLVPLPGADGPMGALGFATSDPARQYGPEDLAFAVDIAHRFAPVVQSALRLEEERTIAETLQRNLLPQRLPDMPELELAARYLPGSAGAAVGGDWYDVLPLPNGSVLLAIGDVVGHGVIAAATMGRARAAAQLCALTEVEPGDLLTRLNTFMSTVGDASMLTLFVALHEPFTGRLRYASAGHLPPVVRSANGPLRFLESSHGPPLGADAAHQYGASFDALAPGEELVLYTDGLVERRGEPLDEGLRRLARAVHDGPGELEGLVGHLLDTMLPDGGAGDDVAVLVARSVADAERLELVLPAEPEQLRVLRRRLAGWLERHGVDRHTIFDLNVAASEAAANAVSHAYGLASGEFRVEAHWDDDVVVCLVSDDGRWQSRPRGDDGRGLMLMRTLSDGVDIRTDERGTSVELRRRVARRQPDLGPRARV